MRYGLTELARLLPRRSVWAGALLAYLLALASPALAGARVALVIGNSNYPTFGTLANPANDADDIAVVLRGIGFEVTEQKDVDGRDFAQLLSNFATAAQGADVALFYYSGHGLQYQNENYLLPVDARLANSFALKHETMALGDIMDAMSAAHSALVFIDACRSFPITETFFASPNERVTPASGLASPDLLRNTFVGFASQAGRTASDGFGRNSPFTAAMLEYLPTAGLDVGTMFASVAGKVVQATAGAQRPQSFGGMAQPLTLVASADPSPAAATDGPNLQERAYNDAKAIDTLGAYRAFVTQFPGGYYANLAYERIAKLQPAAPAPAADAASPTLSIPPSASTNVAMTGPAMGAVSGTLCDQLAGVPDDPGRQTAGVKFKDVDGPRAVQACQAAVSVRPDEPRYYYQLSRALTVTEDIPGAVAALKHAVDLNYPSAMYQYAVDMRDGISMAKDLPGAIDLMTKAATAGSGDAMASLGMLYSRDGVVPRDDKATFDWNKRGADANNALAINNLATMYRDGRGVTRNGNTAMALFEQAMKQGFPPAFYNLGMMLNGGEGFPANYLRAAQLLLQGATRDKNVYNEFLKTSAKLDQNTVTELQKLLRGGSYYSGPTNGQFGPATRAAMDKATAG